MAVNDVYRLNVDYTLAEQVTSPISGKTAFIPYVNISGGSGLEADVTIVGPLGTEAAADAVAVTLSTENLALLPASLGAKTSAASFSVVPASDATFKLTAPTVTDYSATNMTGASQTLLAAGNGTNLIFLQAPAANSGSIWINLAGGTAVVGSGVQVAPGGNVSIQPGIANVITGIAATINDDLTIYAG